MTRFLDKEVTKTPIKTNLIYPLVIVAFTVIISGLLIPYFTRRWQNHQKELELKADLVIL
ncbi:MAG TPA: hypothetical protein VEP90_03000 [Methylomirabilota bacterium]|nr:hypothetical protein [Candidatus Acidoferrum sp.]HYT41291.1 hypothetical protein [Methylomirabilota bacterium]